MSSYSSNTIALGVDTMEFSNALLKLSQTLAVTNERLVSSEPHLPIRPPLTPPRVRQPDAWITPSADARPAPAPTRSEARAPAIRRAARDAVVKVLGWGTFLITISTLIAYLFGMGR